MRIYLRCIGRVFTIGEELFELAARLLPQGLSLLRDLDRVLLDQAIASILEALRLGSLCAHEVVCIVTLVRPGLNVGVRLACCSVQHHDSVAANRALDNSCVEDKVSRLKRLQVVLLRPIVLQL